METNSKEEVQLFLMSDYVDLSSLPAPKVVEELDHETIFRELLRDFKERKPDYDALVESDPVVIALEVAAYREVLLRNRINQAAKGCMLAYAIGEDLDNLAAFYKVKRMTIKEGDPLAIPPILPVFEDDDRLRLRTQLALESFTTAGSTKAYEFHTYSASPKIKSVYVDSPNPGEILITILSNEGDGTASTDLIKEVKSYLRDEDRRPLTDKVEVQSAEIITYQIKAKIYVYPGPSIPVVEQEYREKLAKYVSKRHRIKEIVAYSGIYESLHTEGVQKVDLILPEDNITTSKIQAAFCTNINVEVLIANGQ